MPVLPYDVRGYRRYFEPARSCSRERDVDSSECWHLEIRSDPRATQAQVRDYSGPDRIRPHRESHRNFDLEAFAPPMLHDRSLGYPRGTAYFHGVQAWAIRMSAYVLAAPPEGIRTGVRADWHGDSEEWYESAGRHHSGLSRRKGKRLWTRLGGSLRDAQELAGHEARFIPVAPLVLPSLCTKEASRRRVVSCRGGS